jgi:hypothetical protein
MSYLNYCTKKEQQVVIELIAAILSTNSSVSVNDGEEWTVKESTDKLEILQALNSTDADLLRLRCADTGECVGWISLVWDNNYYQPAAVICDHEANDYTDSIVDPILERWN